MPIKSHSSVLISVLVAVGVCAGIVRAADAPVPFDGSKSAWHDGFDRFDYVMDDQTLEITPFKAPDGEKFGIHDPPAGQHRCVVVAPKNPAPGNPWSWRGCYWDHQPQTEIELLKRGFHIAYISANATLRPGKQWDAWYEFLTQKHGLSPKPCFIGMSRGGEFAYTWATAHPDEVSCIYVDNPGSNRDLLLRTGILASYDVPLLHICGSIDPLLGRFSSNIESNYEQLGGRISMMIKDGNGHHPHSLRDATPIADWMEKNIQPREDPMPPYIGQRASKNWFYPIEDSYRYFPKEGKYITCRGAAFSNCYRRYMFELPGVEGAITVIAPLKAAPGNPWVYRADFVGQGAKVDLALLAHGFHIVTGPVPYNADGPHLEHWNAVYKHLVAHGFSTKPVMEGDGRAAGEAYAWAVANPDKVSCVYGENPVLLCNMTKAQPIDHLDVLAKAGVPLLHVCGSLDLSPSDQTHVVEQRYKGMGGHITVIIDEGKGHYPLAPQNPKPVVDFIVENAH